MVRGRYTRVHATNAGLSAGLSSGGQQELQMNLAAVQDPAVRSVLGALTTYTFPIVQDQFDVTAQVTVPVTDLLMTLLPAALAAQHGAHAEDYVLEAAKEALELRAREAFFGYVRARGALALAQASLHDAQENQRQVEAMERVGAASGVDLDGMEAKTAVAQVMLARAKGGVAVAERTLRTVLHLDPSKEIRIGEDSHARPAGGAP